MTASLDSHYPQTVGTAKSYRHKPLDLSSAIFRLPNAVTTPHIAGVTDGTSRKRAACAAENLDRIAAGLEPLYRIDQ